MRPSTATLCLVLCALSTLALAQDPRRDIRQRGTRPRGSVKQEVETEPRTPPRPIVLPTPDGNLQVMIPEEGAPLEDVVTAWAETTGQKFTFSESDFRGQGRVQLRGITHLEKADIDWFFQGLMAERGFAMIPVGAAAARTWSLVRYDQSQRLKSLATFVLPSEAASVARHPARVFMTAFPLKEIEVSDARQILSNVLSRRSAEWVQEVRSSNTLMVVGFGPTIASVAKLIEQVDRPLPEKIQKRRDARPGPVRR